MRPGAKAQAGVTFLLGLLVVWGGGGPAAAAALDLLVVPDQVEIGAFFQGHQVMVSGQIPAGAEAVLEVRGRNAPEKLLRKGRRGGLWMNVGELEIRGAPSLYLALSTKPELLAASPPDAPWGFSALERRITFAGSLKPQELAEFRHEFMELKESEHLYAVLPGALRLAPAQEGRQAVQGVFQLPANVKPDTYRVCLAAIRHGQVMEQQCADLQVLLVGFPALFAALAYEHGALYGILAAVIAIATGFLMGYLFKGGGGH